MPLNTAVSKLSWISVPGSIPGFLFPGSLPQRNPTKSVLLGHASDLLQRSERGVRPTATLAKS